MLHLVSEAQLEIEGSIFSEDKKKERSNKVAEDLRGGRKVTDFRFDMVFPLKIRSLSKTHWTPVEVAIRAAELLMTQDGTRILDIGSGCGKFCIVAALSTPGHFTGVEQRPDLIEVATKTATELKVPNAAFIQNNMTELDWSLFDAFYLFNPFYEHQIKSIRIDASLSYGQDKFFRYVEVVKSKLKLAPTGTKVVTYHGFGGEMPLGYQCQKKEAAGSSYLELWEKVTLLPNGVNY